MIVAQSDIAIASMHATLDAMFAVDHGEPRIEGMVRGLLRAYAEHYSPQDQGWVSLRVEDTFVAPVFNPDAKKRSASRSFCLGGKRDVVIFREDRPDMLYLMDHKTSSEDISDASSYWQRLLLDTQPATYVWSLYLEGIKVHGVIWDVVRKPASFPKKLTLKKPKKLTKAMVSEIIGSQSCLGYPVSKETFMEVSNGMLEENEELFKIRLLADARSSELDGDGFAEIVSRQTYLGQPVSYETFEAVASRKIETENAELYGLRVYSEAINNPDDWFRREAIPLDMESVFEVAREQWDVSEEIVRYRSRYNGKPWPKTGAPNACFAYQRPCEFVDLCTKRDRPETAHWRHRQANPELDIANKEELLPILSNSSIGDFRSCARKYQYRHELKIEKAIPEDSEALHVGTLIHEGLEAYWRAKLSI